MKTVLLLIGMDCDSFIYSPRKDVVRRHRDAA
jgi:hypothetical protein